MIATMSQTAPHFHRRSSSQGMNAAGAPLPRIPRRTSSSGSSHTSPNATPGSTPSPAIHVQQATPPEQGSSKDIAVAFPTSPVPERSLLSIRARRLKRQAIAEAQLTSPTPRMQKEQNEPPLEFLSTPTPPTSISLDSIALTRPGHTKSFSVLDIGSPALFTKSGRPIKSSLKSSSFIDTSTLTVVTGLPITKSEPATPKAVHFDAQLEHVKLFLSAQRPAAVSRSGSPVDDTSGTDSDFPTRSVNVPDDRKLVMTTQNMPSMVDKSADIVLLEMSMVEEGPSIVGRIRVRNLAFQKWIAVRFTFDDWQTTSEVAAKYADADGPEFDIFSFTIKLSDILVRIETKTLVLALHYRVNGRDIWDNNGGKNYVASFSRIPAPQVKRPRLTRKASSEDEGVSSGDLRDLLEKVAIQARDAPDRPRFLRRPSSDAPSRSRSPSPTIDGLPGSGSFGTRYEFDLKRPWNGAPRARTPTHPASGSQSSVPFPGNPKPVNPPRVALGSPRDRELLDTFPADSESGPSTLASNGRPRTQRNHQRGFFDDVFGEDAYQDTVVKRTPVTSSHCRWESENTASTTSPASRPSFTSMESIKSPLPASASELRNTLSMLATDEGVSEDSTPSILSPSSSSSRSLTPSPEPFSSFVAFPEDDGVQVVESPGTSYRHFVNK